MYKTKFDKFDILRKIAKEQNTIEDVAIELVKLMPKGIFFEILDLVIVDLEFPYDINKSLIQLYYKLGKKVFGNHLKVQAHFKENFDDFMTMFETNY